ncbi:hypothetical protein jhhlp_006241 [Lomentospora prolificans]|uniref:Uncharacterized protein n=1 Tax=Lomentospora prolificans TaxID=41688 RepID=A0A2N3N5C9_9PEZI|nr:hypothetical protein jhhlp_006241 [Lomentospora prolificans]
MAASIPAPLLFPVLLSLLCSSAAQEYGYIELPEPTLMPRYYLGDPRPTLQKRQNKCEEGHHQCVDVGFADTCCADDRYCYVDHVAVTARCCPLELNCDSTCGSLQYYCPSTTSIVSAELTVASVIPACCSRACTSKGFYRCEESAGGQCCPYGNVCANSLCLSTKTTAPAPRVTALDEGCTTSQTKCDDGQGCCNVWQVCTSLSGSPVCAPGPSMTTVWGQEEDDSGTLSDGAKAGIGAGVAIGASAATAGLTWLWLSRRRRARAMANAASSGEEEFMEEAVGSPDPPTTSGLTRDYFGPNAVDGPLTERDGDEALTPGQRDRGVPAQPHAPEDIAAPVEIDSRNISAPVASERAYPSPLPPFDATAPETPEHRAELYGSEVIPLVVEAPGNETPSRAASPESEAPKSPKTK